MTYTNYHCNIDIKDNPEDLSIKEHIDVALRNNKKRKFLFVSKKLGKHIPVKPKKVDELGESLAYEYKKKFQDYKDNKQIVLGFAETATCLAHSFFEHLESSISFAHTTREVISNLDKIEFLEEHSHATEQILYRAGIENSIEKVKEIILVDDEITTANTCINIIKKLKAEYNVERFVIASLLNWIDDARMKEIQKVAEELKCKIEFVYLLAGTFEFKYNEENKLADNIEIISKNKENEMEIDTITLDFKKYCYDKKYLKYTGRFGISRDEQETLKKIIKEEGKKLRYNEDIYKVLALGSEEFMYIPMMLSREINKDVYYHSITRSPIIPMKDKGYPINSKYKFTSFNNDNTTYLYNLDAHSYRECYLFIEIETDSKKLEYFIDTIRYLGIKKLKIIRF